MPEISFLIPCRNEEETISLCIDEIKSVIDRRDLHAEVLVVDNNSRDRSPEIARSLGARVVHEAQKGYGCAIRRGIEASKGEHIIMGDGDGSYDFSDSIRFLNELRAGYDMVIGNRFSGGIEHGAMPFLHRYVGVPFLTWLGKYLFQVEVNDFHCGLRAFKRRKIERLELSSKGMELASEMIVLSSICDLDITEVPTHLSQDERSKEPHLNTWTDGLRHLLLLLSYAPRITFLYPGIVILCSSMFYFSSYIGLYFIQHMVIGKSLITLTSVVTIGLICVSQSFLVSYYHVIGNFSAFKVSVIELSSIVSTGRLLIVNCVFATFAFVLFSYASIYSGYLTYRILTILALISYMTAFCLVTVFTVYYL